jgi:isoleucyl-tRNA synthetase
MPLIYRAMSCWFVNVQKIKDTMLASNEKITWVPSHLKHGRFGKWLEGARDWAISRNRFWGNPIPVWKCDNSDYIEVIGSVAELEEKSGVKVDDLHKHYVDDLTWPSPDGTGTMRRIPDVLDCWFESGSMPYAQHHYPFENKEHVDNNFPADFICEGLDQTRGWFYTLTIIASGLFESPAFLNCITNGIVLTKEGKKMSKRDRNYTDPMEVIDKYGADALRFALMNSAVVKADDLKFSEDGVKDVIKTFLLPIYNAYSFFVTYANIDNYEPSSTPFEKLENPLDKWIISTTQGLIQNVTEALDSYDIQKAAGIMVSFIDDLNNWYIRRSRRRFWRSENDSDKKMAYDTLYYVLLTVVKVAAPVIPFLTESIYLNLRTEDMPISVHLCDFPEYNEAQRDLTLEKQMSLTMKSINMGRSLRSAHNLKTRQPLSKVYLVDRSEEDREILKSMVDIISEELNVKEVLIQADESELVDYSAKANFKVLGKQLGPKMKEVAALIMKLSSQEIASILDGNTKELEYSDGTISLTEADIMVQRSEKANLKVVNENELTIGFDTELTADLLKEGVARDIVRAIQTLRKDKDFDVSDHISINYDGDSNIDTVFEEYKDYILNETLCDSLTKVTLSTDEIEVGDNIVKIDIAKL